MKSLIVLFLSLSLGACATTPKKQEKPISVQSYTASEGGFLVNSHLIMSGGEAVLVDAQFLRSEARKVIEMIKASGKELTTVFITHAHPDHYLGLELITREFPKAMIVSTPDVIEDIHKTAKDKIKYWKGIYKDDLADNYVTPVALQGNEIDVGNEKIRVIPLGPGECEHGAALYIPTLETLVAGDLIYNEVHLWLAENRPLGWLRNLKDIRDIGIIDQVLTGHGAPSAGLSIIEANEHYIQAFINATQRPATRKQAAEWMKQRYSDFALPIIVDLSVAGRLKQ